MNKLIFSLLVFLFSFAAFAQEKEESFIGETSFQCEFYHLGSYSKERPVYLLQQNINYIFSPHFSGGIGVGFALYPAALALPVSFNANYHFNPGKTPLIWKNSFGANIIAGDLFFAASNFKSGIAIQLFKEKPMHLIPEAGFHFLFDGYGGKALSIYGGIGITYKIF